jgi:hypothetical protein
MACLRGCDTKRTAQHRLLYASVMGSDPEVGPEVITAMREAFGGLLGAPQGWSKVYLWESEWGVGLPEPYRSFVATVGDGCLAGPPSYGWLPLGKFPQDADRVPDRKSIRRPFPLEGAWIWEDEPELSCEEDARIGATYTDGVLNLGTDGCGLYHMLVVTGRERGHMWEVADVGAFPAGVDQDSSMRIGFAKWVINWATDRD